MMPPGEGEANSPMPSVAPSLAGPNLAINQPMMNLILINARINIRKGTDQSACGGTHKKSNFYSSLDCLTCEHA